MSSANANPLHNLDASRRPPPYGRPAEELHLPPTYGGMAQQQHQAQSTYSSFASPQESSRGSGQPGSVQLTGGANLSLPGSLQRGNSLRPAAATSPTAAPLLPPISTQSQGYQTPSRMAGVDHPHNYARLSPSAPFMTTDESKFTSPTNHKYSSSQTMHGASYSPLGLADIRPPADSSLSDDPLSAHPYPHDGNSASPKNCHYLAPWATYAFDWCKWPVQQHGLGDAAGKMAIGSYLEDGHNSVCPVPGAINRFELMQVEQIQILDTQIVPDPEPDSTPGAPQYGIEFIKCAEATHSYPFTRILWEPESSAKKSCDLLATSGDHLRLWSLPSQKPNFTSSSITRSSNSNEAPTQRLAPLALLSNSKSPEHTAPLTSLDWNTLSPSLIITSSIDTTCTIWDIPSLTAKTQLIAHDKEVFDVRFCANSVDVFVSCGADGSVRMFDLRSLEHSTIIYEPSEKNDQCKHPRS